MKKQFLFLAMAVLSMAGFVSCNDDDDDDESPAQVENVKVFSSVTDSLGNVAYDSQWQDVHYSYDASTGQLTIEVDSVTGVNKIKPEFFWGSVKNDTCTLSIDFQRAYCREELFHPSIVLDGFAKKTYTVKVWNGVSTYYIADIDMTKSSTGTFEQKTTAFYVPVCCGVESDLSTLSKNVYPKDSLPILPVIHCLFPTEE